MGSKNTIKKHMPIILFEQGVSDFIDGRSNALSLLESFGYTKFATIKNYPGVKKSKNIFVKFLQSIFIEALAGESLQIRIENRISPDFYPFLIAIPDWLDTAG